MNALRNDLKRIIFVCKRYFLLLSVCIIIESIATYLQPLLITKITDKGIIENNFSVLSYSVFLFLLVKIMGAGSGVLRSYGFMKIHNKMFALLNEKMFEKLYRCPMNFYKEKNGMEIINALQTDIQYLSAIFDEIAAVSVGAVFQVISGMFGLSIVNTNMTLILFVMIGVKYEIVTLFSKRKRDIIKENLNINNQFMSWLEEQINGIREMKLWTLYNFKNKDLRKVQKVLLGSYQKNIMWDQKYSFCESIIDAFVIGFMYVFGGYLVIQNQMTAGSLLAFVTYCGTINSSIALLIDVKYYFAKIKPSADRFYNFLNGEEETSLFTKSISDYVDEQDKKPMVEFQNVKFSYDNQKKILDGISFQIYKGEKVAIIGKNGVGKTTIFDLITGICQTDEGTIKIEGQEIQKIGVETIRKNIAVVSQNPFFYNASVRDNIDLEKKYSKEEVVRVCQKSGADDFISQMEKGYATILGSGGQKLSGGERQKIAVSRAVLKRAKIVLLDEATTGYDMESRKTSMKELFPNQTVIVITHHQEELEGMDKIYRLHQGKIEKVNRGEKNDISEKRETD